MTPSPVFWGQEKFRDTNNSSVGFGKWFARIGHGSVRELPYTTRVNGNETEIVGYSYTPNGIEEPTVGNDWYPVVIDSYMTAEYESLDAYLASEYGQIFISSIGVSALVPLATATQRLAENGINITVIEPEMLFNRFDPEGAAYLLVNKRGQLVYLTEGDNQSFFLYDEDIQGYKAIGPTQVDPVLSDWGSVYLGQWTAGQDKTVTVDGVRYTFTAQGSYYTLTPAAGTYSE